MVLSAREIRYILHLYVFGDLRRLLFGFSRRDSMKWSARPKPLRTRRRRALTLPSSSPGARKSSTNIPIYEQEQSAFFTKLPLEIRLLIYQEVLAPKDHPMLHVASGHKRLFSCRCSNTDPHRPGWCHKCWGLMVKLDGTIGLCPFGESIYPHPVRIQMLRSCRRMYVRIHCF